MKKSLIALAALASFASMASAQSSVTLFGMIDAAVSYGSGSVSNRTQLANSRYNSSRLGFRGTEDLGGGMSASFWLEAGFNNDDGSGQTTNSNNQASGTTGGGGLTFNRRSTMSLAGGWGELRLGRDYTPQFTNMAVFDPFGTNGVGTTQMLSSIITGATAIRASNSVGYFLPSNLGGFYGQLQYYMGENSTGPVTSRDGNGAGLRVGFADGPVNVALAVSRTKYAAGEVTQNNIGGSYQFAIGKLQAQYSRDSNDALAAGGAHAKGWLIGGRAPIGSGASEIRLDYSGYEVDTPGTPKTRKLALGYVYTMSKRTILYATYAHANNSGGANFALNGAVTGANAGSNGYEMGINHAF